MRFSTLGDLDDLEEDFPDLEEAADMDEDGSVERKEVIVARRRSTVAEEGGATAGAPPPPEEEDDGFRIPFLGW